jgi:hypothetical protein
MTLRTLTSSLLATLLLAASGCGVELSGEGGDLNFNYLGTELQSGASSGTLAAGSRIDIELRLPGTSDSLPVRDVFSEASDILDVIHTESHRFTLEALSPGTARIRAEAQGEDAESISDSVEISVATVDRVELGVRCSDPVFVIDSHAQFRYRMFDASSSKLTGYGHFAVAVEPSTGGQINASMTQIEVLEISTGSVPGSYEIVPTVEGESFAFELVAPADIVFASLTEDDDETELSVSVGSDAAVALFNLETGDSTVCGPATAAIDLSTDTPAICEPSYSFYGDLHFLLVEGISAGTCEVRFQIPGTDIEHLYTVEVIP